MRRRVFRALLVGGAIAAAVAMGAGQAFAAGTITITGGGPFTATSSNVMLRDVSSGTVFSCTKSTISGSIANVTNAPLPYTTTQAGGSPHSITSVTFAGCSTSFGTVTVTAPATDLPDDIVFVGVTPSLNGHIQPAGTAGGLFQVSVLTCSFNVAGAPNFNWTNLLTFTGTGIPHPTNVSAGCFGVVGSTDSMTFTGTYTVTSSVMFM